MTISANYPSIRPTLLLDFANGEALDPRITFSRPTTGTYYDGKTSAIAEQNLQTYSQDYTNAIWQKQNASITANSTTAPDGTATASTLTASASSNFHIINVQTTYVGMAAGTYTLSQYFKAGTSNFVSLGAFVNASSWISVTANLSTVAITQTATGGVFTSVGSSITASSNGFYRVTVTFSITGTTGFLPCMQINSTATPTLGTFGLETWTAAGTETIFLWGSQTENRSTVTAYQVTTTAPITNYIPVLLTAPANAPRFDHNPTTGESLGLLIEEQRTNLLLRSEEFDNASWTKARASIAANTIVAPDGTLTGDKIVEDTTTNSHLAYQNVTGTAVAATYSVYAKPAGRNWIALIIADSGGTDRVAFFNISSGVVGTLSTNLTASISSVGNGWYRCSVTVSTWRAGSTYIYAAPANADNSFNYLGDGYSGIYIWGAQLEAGAFATSYVPTVASQVTRSADSASMTGTNFSSWYNQGQGTLYSEANTILPTSQGQNTVALFLDNSNYIIGGQYVSTLSRAGYIYANNAEQASLTFAALSAGTFNKFAIAFQANNIAGTINAQTVVTDTNALIPNVNSLTVGNFSTSGNQNLNGCIKKIAYYPLRLTNAQLQALTGS